MAKVYPILYLFENSARGVISAVLATALGPDWWLEVTEPKRQKAVRDRKEQEGKDAWHSRRGSSELDYLDLPDLIAIVEHPKAQAHFSGIFPRAHWFSALVHDLNVSRRVVAHMNPLSEADIQQVEAAFKKWSRQLQAKASEIPGIRPGVRSLPPRHRRTRALQPGIPRPRPGCRLVLRRAAEAGGSDRCIKLGRVINVVLTRSWPDTPVPTAS
jgi:hypothetical protein